MDLFLICRDAVENSIISNLLMAMEAKKAGTDVGILFTQEALAAACGEAFDWSPLLRERERRIGFANVAKEQGLPIYEAPTRRSIAIDTRKLLKEAKAAGVPMYACPAWTGFLGLRGKLLPELTEMDHATLLKTIKEAKTIIGSF